MNSELNEEREQFETWVSSPPFEYDVDRFYMDETKYAWPGQYKDLKVELAWDAWQESNKQPRSAEKV